MANYLDLIASRLPPLPFAGRLGERFAGLVGGIVHNTIAEGASLAVQALWLIAGQPEADLGYTSNRTKLRRYIVESAEQFRARLENAIVIWESGGSEVLLEGQYDAAGYTGTRILSPRDWNREPHDYPSQFWVYMPRTAHLAGTMFHICGTGVLAGSPAAICGTGTIFKEPKRIGLPDTLINSHLIGVDAPVERVAEVQSIVRTFKRGREVCRQIIIAINGHLCGSGDICGTAVCGGTFAKIGVGVAEA